MKNLKYVILLLIAFCAYRIFSGKDCLFFKDKKLPEKLGKPEDRPQVNPPPPSQGGGSLPNPHKPPRNADEPARRPTPPNTTPGFTTGPVITMPAVEPEIKPVGKVYPIFETEKRPVSSNDLRVIAEKEKREIETKKFNNLLSTSPAAFANSSKSEKSEKSKLASIKIEPNETFGKVNNTMIYPSKSEKYYR